LRVYESELAMLLGEEDVTLSPPQSSPAVRPQKKQQQKGEPEPYIRGAVTSPARAPLWSRTDLTMRRAVINGAAGIVAFLHGRPFSIAALTVKNGKIAEIDFLADPDRIAHPTYRARRLAHRVLLGPE
jgi:hypothetical protein